MIWLLSTVQNITATCSESQRGTEGQKQCLSIIHKDGEMFTTEMHRQALKDLQTLHTPTPLLRDHAGMKGSIPSV